jgi:hypothetical protein
MRSDRQGSSPTSGVMDSGSMLARHMQGNRAIPRTSVSHTQACSQYRREVWGSSDDAVLFGRVAV